MDFSKMEQLHLVRSFSQGFVTVFGERSGPHSMPDIPGLDHRSGSVPKNFLLPSQGYCDVVEDRPTFILVLELLHIQSTLPYMSRRRIHTYIIYTVYMHVYEYTYIHTYI